MAFPLIFCVFEAIYNFSYTGESQNRTLESGFYKLEVWGANGCGSSYDYEPYGIGGRGGYSIGYLNLEERTTVYIQVGGVGNFSISGLAAGGYNGGGCAWGHNSDDSRAHGGGGGTDIRINEDSNYSRVIVAGGGGGGGATGGERGYYGGGLTGGGNSATQNSSSNGGDFFQGAHTGNCGGGGRGGWYGGGTYRGSQTKPTKGISNCYNSGGSGGSGYVYTESTAKDYPNGCKLTSKYYLTDASTFGGYQQITEPDGRKSYGHSRNGFARITYQYGYEPCNYFLIDNEFIVKGFRSGNCKKIVEIKPTLDGYNVVSIENNAFKGQSCIEEVKLPETIREIGSSAFENCVNLVRVSSATLSKLISIGDSAFKGCFSLNSIGVTAFGSDSIHILNLSYCNSLKTIPSFAFKDCTKIVEVHLPQELENIGDNAFENCESLRHINLQFNLKLAGRYCFNGCRSLKKINIPYSLDKIRSFMFGSSGIETVLIHSDAVVDGYAFYNCNYLKRVEIFDNAIVMPNAFSNCANIQKVVVYEYVTLYDNSFDTISSSVYYFGTTDVCYPSSEDGLKKINTTVYVRNEYPSDKFCEIQIVKCTSGSVQSSKCLNTPYYDSVQRLALRTQRK